MSALGDAAAVTPDVNQVLMSTGDLGASLEAAVAGYESVADMLMAELTAMGLNTSTTAVVGWQGPGGVAMQMSATDFMALCGEVSAWVRVGQLQAGEVAAAHAAALQSMIPAPVVWTNRATQTALIHANFAGLLTGAIVALEEQYGQFWVQNATARTGYGGVVTTALTALAVPPPIATSAADPAGAAAAVGSDAAQSAAGDAMQTSAKTMTQVADSPVKDAASSPGGAMSSMMGEFGQLGSMFGQVAGVGQQLPQMLGQAPQMLSGLLGPLSSGMGGMNGASAGALSPGAAGALGGGGGIGGLSSLAGAAGGGGGLIGETAGPASSFVRPANSFSAPNSPTLPAGWRGDAGPGGAGQSRSAGMGGGGLYGAPPPMGREGNAESTPKSARTMQVTARPGANREERQPT